MIQTLPKAVNIPIPPSVQAAQCQALQGGMLSSFQPLFQRTVFAPWFWHQEIAGHQTNQNCASQVVSVVL